MLLIQKKAKMLNLQKKIKTCFLCPLYKTRKNVVLGKGSLNTNLMFVGEAPGEKEDIQAKPFVGRAGKLLSKIINAIGLNNDFTYITNIVKCRPPKNRTPYFFEIKNCSQYLRSEINILKPKFICALGAVSAHYLINTNKSLFFLRGKIYNISGTKLMATYHPAYLLRNPQFKKIVWNDLKRITNEISTSH